MVGVAAVNNNESFLSSAGDEVNTVVVSINDVNVWIGCAEVRRNSAKERSDGPVWV